MDPMLGEPALAIGTPASYQSYPQQTQTPSANSSTSYYAEPPQNPQDLHNASSAASVGASSYPQQAYAGAMEALTQDAGSIHNFPQQQPASYSDANHAPASDSRSAYPYALDANSAYATHQQAQAQSAPADQLQLPSSVDVQALLDKLSTPANGAALSQFSPPSVAQSQQSAAAASSLPVALNLPPRPPPQEKPATHPNYNPNDDIRSFHPHSSHRGSTQLQPLNLRAGAAGNSDASALRANMSPSASGPNSAGYSQRPSQEQGSGAASGDDEDERWPPEVNKIYEDFLDQERRFVTEGQWDQFPNGSRLFIGEFYKVWLAKGFLMLRYPTTFFEITSCCLEALKWPESQPSKPAVLFPALEIASRTALALCTTAWI